MSDSHEIEIEDRVFSKIKDALSSSSSTEQPEICKIRKVQPHDRPRENTMSAYTPRIISIGPLHHGKPELQPMEVLKHKYLNELLNGRGEDLNYKLSSDGKNDELLGRFIAEARKMETKVRKSYELSNIDTIESDDFVRMLVIDGCFLLEYLQTFNKYLGRLGLLIDHDIKLFENQIPFFVLQKFHEILTEFNPSNYKKSIVEVAHSYMTENHVTFGFAFSEAFSTAFSKRFVETKNLLHLHYVNVEGVNVEGVNVEGVNVEGVNVEGVNVEGVNVEGVNVEGVNVEGVNVEGVNVEGVNVEGVKVEGVKVEGVKVEGVNVEGVNVEGVNVKAIFCRLFLLLCAFPSWICLLSDSVMKFLVDDTLRRVLSQILTSSTNITYREVISATEIEEAGVRFQGSRMDLRFKKGTLTIPVLTLNQESLRLLKNLMVFEFYFRSHGVPPYVHAYVSFLSLLIKNPGDLKVMEKHRIIRTSGGGDESFALVTELIQAGFDELILAEKPTMVYAGLKSIWRFSMIDADFKWPPRFSIINDLKTYCKEPRHRWWAMLMKDYFGNPWSILGVLAGVILLVLTTLQTVLDLI